MLQVDSDACMEMTAALRLVNLTDIGLPLQCHKQQSPQNAQSHNSLITQQTNSCSVTTELEDLNSCLREASSTAAGQDGKKCCDAEGGGSGLVLLLLSLFSCVIILIVLHVIMIVILCGMTWTMHDLRWDRARDLLYQHARISSAVLRYALFWICKAQRHRIIYYALFIAHHTGALSLTSRRHPTLSEAQTLHCPYAPATTVSPSCKRHYLEDQFYTPPPPTGGGVQKLLSQF